MPLAYGSGGGVTYDSGEETAGTVRPVSATDTFHFLFFFNVLYRNITTLN